MGLSDLQKGFGSALLRSSSPEGKLIAELQAACVDGLQVASVTLTVDQFKNLTTPLAVTPVPPAGSYHAPAGMDLLYVPGSDVLSDPLTASNGAAIGLSHGDPAVNTYNAISLAFGANLFLSSPFPLFVACILGNQTALKLTEMLGQPLTLQFESGVETISGNAAGDAKFRFHVYYHVRNLDF